MQNLVYFMIPSEDAEDISWKAGNLLLNRFCIDEDAGCELSGVYKLKEWSREEWNEVLQTRSTSKLNAKINAKC